MYYYSKDILFLEDRLLIYYIKSCIYKDQFTKIIDEENIENYV